MTKKQRIENCKNLQSQFDKLSMDGHTRFSVVTSTANLEQLRENTHKLSVFDWPSFTAFNIIRYQNLKNARKITTLLT